MAGRRFPLPWTVEEQPACFVVRDHNGNSCRTSTLRTSSGAALSGQAADARRGTADCGRHREAALDLKRRCRQSGRAEFCGPLRRREFESAGRCDFLVMRWTASFADGLQPIIAGSRSPPLSQQPYWLCIANEGKSYLYRFRNHVETRRRNVLEKANHTLRY